MSVLVNIIFSKPIEGPQGVRQVNKTCEIKYACRCITPEWASFRYMYLNSTHYTDLWFEEITHSEYK